MSAKYAALVIASSCFVAGLLAQTPTATLVGRIVDATGSVVPGATIQVREVETNKTRSTESQLDGGYTISNLAPGLYDVTIDKAGFRRLVENRLELRVAQTARLDAQLEVGSTGQSIVVDARVPLLNTENASRGDVIVNHEMTEMPLNGRDFIDLAFMVAGVAPSEPSAKGWARSDWAPDLSRSLAKVCWKEALSRPVIHAVDDYTVCLTFNAKDDPVREVNKMADLEGELFLLRDYRTAFRQLLERVDRLNESAKPPLGGFRFLFDITNEPNVVLGIEPVL